MRTYTLNTARAQFRATVPARPQAPIAHRPSPARLGGPLTNTQKAELSILCRQAFDLHNTLAGPAATRAAEDFRHTQVHAAVNKPGLTACTQDDYLPLRAHFLHLLGRDGEALNAHMAHGTEDKRVALFKLNESLAKANLPMAYAAAIARRQRHGRGIDELTAKELWQLIYTINNRGTAKRRKA